MLLYCLSVSPVSLILCSLAIQYLDFTNDSLLDRDIGDDYDEELHGWNSFSLLDLPDCNVSDCNATYSHCSVSKKCFLSRTTFRAVIVVHPAMFVVKFRGYTIVAVQYLAKVAVIETVETEKRFYSKWKDLDHYILINSYPISSRCGFLIVFMRSSNSLSL